MSDSNLGVVFRRVETCVRDDIGVLAAPFDGLAILEDHALAEVGLRWWYCNPHGPTAGRLGFWMDPDSSLVAIGHTMLHPTMQRMEILAMVPESQLSDPATTADMLDRIIKRHGDSIMPNPPTSIMVEASLLFDGQDLHERLRPLSERWEPGLLGNAISAMRRFPADPVGRIDFEFDRMLAVFQSGDTGQPSEPDDFEQWLRLVTDQEHVQNELAAIRGFMGAWLEE